jgi:hypothetical protein
MRIGGRNVGGTEGTLRTPEPSLVAFGLDQVHHLSLRLNVRLNVTLGRAQGGMARQHLHVTEVIIARG